VYKEFEGRYIGNPCCLSGKFFMVSTGLLLPTYLRYVLANVPERMVILRIWSDTFYDGAYCPNY